MIAPYVYPPHIFKLLKGSKYDTLIDVTLLYANIVHPTKCNK